MVSGGIVEYSPASATYRLPPEHASCLTCAAVADNLVMFPKYVALFGEVEQPLIQAFTDGGGLPYSAYSRFQQLQAQESAVTYSSKLVGTILPLAPGHRHATDRRRCPRSGVRPRPRRHPHGAGVSAQPVHRLGLYGRRDCGSAQGGGAAGPDECPVRDVRSRIPKAVEAYDAITAFDVVHDLAQPKEVLAAIVRALRRDGTFFMIVQCGIQRADAQLRSPAWHGVVRRLAISLHDGLVGAGWGWARRDVGRGERAGIADGGGPDPSS